MLEVGKRQMIADNDFDRVSELKHMPDDIVRHFVQNGLCLGCNREAREHRAVSDEFAVPLDEVTTPEGEEWIVCWTETMVEGEKNHFCIRAVDHPGRVTRDEFEELYG